MRPLILDIKGNSLDDGPGIRSVVFFKGCPLNCLWCHNPESKSRSVEISFDGSLCVDCGSCREVCQDSALAGHHHDYIDRKRCQLCFDCINACPSGALSRMGHDLTVEEILVRILKDKPYFQHSGGGVTLSGGEPTLSVEFTGELLKRLKEAGVHTLLESCGHFDYTRFSEIILPHTDTLYMDLKLMDPAEHKRYCGVDNSLILANFSRLTTQNIDLLPRVPLVPGITDTDANLKATAEFLSVLGVSRCSVLSYNPLWQKKCRQLGANYPFNDSREYDHWTSRDKKKHCIEIFTQKGIKIIDS